MKLAYTRRLVSAALCGELDDVETRTDPIFGLEIPRHVVGVPDEVLQPRATWDDPEAYDKQATSLANMFAENFKQFAGGVSVAAGGGSICHFDGTKLTVGPQSAGADPGPACYGKGGVEPTVTTDLAAGRLPWVSLKTPGWAAMADGTHDAEIDQLLTAHPGAGAAAARVSMRTASSLFAKISILASAFSICF